MIEIYIMRLPEYSTIISEKLLSYVSTERAEMIQRYIKETDKCRALMSELLIRSIIIKKFCVKNNNIKFYKNDYGKPYITLSNNFFFNISHSGEWVLCAISNTEIGIDIEKIIPINYILIANQYFSVSENKELMNISNCNERLRFFFKLWTLKEAYIKAIGRGLSIPLSSFTVSKINEESYFCSSPNLGENSYYLKVFNICYSYIGAVCSHNYNDKCNIIYLDFSKCIEIIETA